ncbi:serine protease family S10 [Achlya hypogyna]|uniref:Serine protease family S10 n=1 Tax=Achlya hypogyna TaxID=1202772 RepID=A0A1V9Z4X7_ACHHY|nr:serine protease family S10 [Achlya hypogyna]
MKSTQYAGFVEVDSKNGGKIFYWLVEAETPNPSELPLTIWLNGGPGCTSMLGLFMECGPFTINEDLTLTPNPHGWQKASNMLFVDQPVGTGLSTLDTKEYPTSGATVAAHFYAFLRGFYQKHPEYVNGSTTRPLYLFGESHAGRWIPQFFSHIEAENDRGATLQIRIAGAGIGNGWVHPATQYDYSGYAHGLGLISLGQKVALETKFAACTAAISSGIYHDPACFANLDTIMDSVRGNVPLNFYDVRAYGSSDAYPPGKDRIGQYLNQPDVRKALHVESSSHPFEYCNYGVYGALGHEDAVSTLHDVDQMLSVGLQVLFFNGQWDMMCNAYNTERVLVQLQWPGQVDFQAAERYTWRTPGLDAPAGFVQSGGNLTFAVVADSGHLVPYDAPAAALDMFTRFVQGRPFADARQAIATPGHWNASASAPLCESDASSLLKGSRAWSMWLAVSLVVGLSSALVASMLTALCLRNGRRRQQTILVEVEEEEDAAVQDNDDDWDDDMVEMEELTKESRQRRTVNPTDS